MRFAFVTGLKPLLVLLSLISMLSLLDAPALLAWSTPAMLPGIPDNIRSPRLAGENDRFHLVFQKDDSQILYYSRGIAQQSGGVNWEAPRVIATGVRYAWSITAANGKLHVAYASVGNEMLYLTNGQQGNPGAWSAPEKIANLSGRANDLDIVLDNDNVPYVVWGEHVAPSKLVIAYRNPTTGVWTRREEKLNFYLMRYPRMVVNGSGDGATVHVMTEYQPSSTSGAFYVSYTSGTRAGALKTVGFSQSFSSAITGNRPTIALDKQTGVIYAGFVAGSNSNGYGLQFSYSTNNGQSWVSVGRHALGGNMWADMTPMIAERDTVYLMLPAKHWVGSGFASIGFYDVRYSRANNSFSAPVPIRNNAGTNAGNASPSYQFNSIAKASTWVTGNTQNIAWNSDLGGRVEPINATLKVNNGEPLTSNPTITISLSNVSGFPNQMRVALDGEIRDSIPLEPFQSSFTRTFSNSQRCLRTVAVQLYNVSGGRSEVLRANINVDTAVQATTLVRNPNIWTNRDSSSIPSSDSANNGHPNYTRDKEFYIEIDGAQDCSKLDKVRVGASSGTYSKSYSLGGGTFFAGDLPLPEPVSAGNNQIFLEISDRSGNSKEYKHTVIYDPLAPVLSTTGTLTINTPNPNATVLVDLKLTGNLVSDNLYPGRHFWGVWVANSRSAVADPANDPNLQWHAVEAPGSASDFTLRNWSLLSGLATAQQTSGTYYVYVRFLDGAGNPSVGVLSKSISLSEVRKPQTRLPIVMK
jgi:hypothetical protein